MLQEQGTQVAKGDLPLIKKDSRLTSLIKFRNIGFGFLGLWVVSLAILFVVRRLGHIQVSTDLTSLLTILVNASVICFMPYLLYISAYKKIEQKRQAAAQGEQQLLADQQPVSQEFSLPITIKYQPAGSIMWVLWAGGIMLVLLIIESIWFGFSLSFTIAMIIAIVACCWVYVVTRRRGHRELTADETGLTLKMVQSEKMQYIPWSEARLFAIETILQEAKQKVQTPRLFELASEREVIRWPGSGKEAMSAEQGIKPVLTGDQYGQQVMEINALVANKTGLALYDLRK